MNILEVLGNRSLRKIEEPDIKSLFELKNKIVTFVNPYSYLVLRKRLDLLSKIDYIGVDGIGLVKILRCCGVSRNIARTSFDMTSVAPLVFERAVQEGKRVYFVGTKPYVIDVAVRNLAKAFVGLNVTGYRNGYFSSDDERKNCIKDILILNPDIVVVGMGVPLQENLLVDLKEGGWTGLGFTCGGFLHQVAKNIVYYPEFINRCDLRWLYRIFVEPKVLWRFLLNYFRFPFVFFMDFMNWKR